MASGKTLRKLIPFPKPTDNDTICADQESMMKTIDEAREGQGTFLQAGVVSSTDWSFTANITEANGELGSEAEVAASEAWLPDPVLAAPELMLSKTAKAAIVKKALSSGALPAVGKFSCIAFELTPTTWNASATVTTKAGVEQASQVAAEANPPATTAGKIQVKQVIVEAVAGPKYKIVGAQKDVRPWAAGVGSLKLVTRAANFTARSGEMANTSAEITATLPAPENNAIIGVFAGVGQVTVTASSGKIFGDFISAETTIKLATNQHVILQSEGGNWKIIAGEPRREQIYAAQAERVAGAEFEPSATRPVQVIAEIRLSIAGSIRTLVGGVAVATVKGIAAEESRFPLSFIVPPGQKYKFEQTAGTSVILVSTLTL